MSKFVSQQPGMFAHAPTEDQLPVSMFEHGKNVTDHCSFNDFLNKLMKFTTSVLINEFRGFPVKSTQ